jgi:dienelactone hydrolase
MKNLMHICCFIIFPFITFLSLKAYGQLINLKPNISFDAISSWPELQSPSLSSSGEYFAYTTFVSETNNRALTIRAINTSWKTEIPNIENYIFTENGKVLIYSNREDGLVIEYLNTKQKMYVSNVHSFELISCNKREVLVYYDNGKTLILMDIKSNRKYIYPDVLSYFFRKENTLLFTVVEVNNTNQIVCKNLINQDADTLPVRSSIGNLTVNSDGSCLAFLCRNSSNSQLIQHFNRKNRKAITLKYEELAGIDSSFFIKEIFRYSLDNNNLFIQIEKLPKSKPIQRYAHVDIWAFSDEILQSQQLQELESQPLMAMINLNTGRLSKLQNEFEDIGFCNDSLVFINATRSYTGERNWNKFARPKSFLLNLITLEKRPLSFFIADISPDRKYLIGGYNHPDSVELIAYNIFTCDIIHITNKLLLNVVNADDYMIQNKRKFFSCGWIKSSCFIFRDDYDIWKINLINPQKITCLTNGYGRKNKISFRFAIKPSGDFNLISNFSLFSAFDNFTKQNGFYQLNQEGKDPLKLTMDDCYYTFDHVAFIEYPPIKAARVNLWVVTKQSASSSPNYYITHDFKSFKAITNHHPEYNYNWLNTSLINFNTLDKNPIQGILYKPDNFDSSRLYPVIIHYYEKVTRTIHIFHKPKFTGSNIDIPYFVSHGYLVFTPDMNLTPYNVPEVVYNSLIGSVDWLSLLPFVDTTKIGLQGHSFGGSQTNLLLCRSRRFAAAISFAGAINLLSFSGSVKYKNGTPYGREYSEISQGRIGYSIGERLDMYIENSPVFNVPNISTPLLIIHNKKDNASSFNQAIEFFTSMYKLRKDVWLLQYPAESHTLGSPPSKKDLTMRMQGFFNYFLKDKPMPAWMESANQ